MNKIKAKRLLSKQFKVDNPRFISFKSGEYALVWHNLKRNLRLMELPTYCGAFRCTHFVFTALAQLFNIGDTPFLLGVLFVPDGDKEHAILCWMDNDEVYHTWDVEAKKPYEVTYVNSGIFP